VVLEAILMRLSLLAPIIAALALPFSSQGSKVEVIGACADSTVSESVRGALEPKGYRITTKDGGVLCEIWLRNGIPPHAKKDIPGAIYTELAESVLVGVIVFPKPANDWRGQAIKPGAYTLRYSLHPTDGNHMGISPYRDFLLLTPAAADRDASAAFKFEELTKLSAKVAGTNHPTPLSLVSTEGQTSFPGLVENEHGHLIFGAKLKMQAGGEVPIAFIVKGVAEQ
jgi:hypothetical protein